MVMMVIPRSMKMIGTEFIFTANEAKQYKCTECFGDEIQLKILYETLYSYVLLDWNGNEILLERVHRRRY